MVHELGSNVTCNICSLESMYCRHVIPHRLSSLVTQVKKHHVFTLKAATKKQKYEKISEKKMSTPVEVLCKVSLFFLESGHLS